MGEEMLEFLVFSSSSSSCHLYCGGLHGKSPAELFRGLGHQRGMVEPPPRLHDADNACLNLKLPVLANLLLRHLALRRRLTARCLLDLDAPRARRKRVIGRKFVRLAHLEKKRKEKGKKNAFH